MHAESTLSDNVVVVGTSAITEVAPEESTGESTRGLELKISEVVCRLRALARNVGLKFAIAAGRLIIESFYEGQLQAWRARGPKDVSFRKLARRPDLPMSPSMLYRCVATYELCSRFPRCLEWRHITASHIRAVLPLDVGMQETMLERAQTERWSVLKLEECVAESLHPVAKRRARASHHLVKTLSRLRAQLAVECELTMIGAEAMDRRAELLALVRDIRATCEKLEWKCDATERERECDEVATMGGTEVLAKAV